MTKKLGVGVAIREEEGAHFPEEMQPEQGVKGKGRRAGVEGAGIGCVAVSRPCGQWRGDRGWGPVFCSRTLAVGRAASPPPEHLRAPRLRGGPAPPFVCLSSAVSGPVRALERVGGREVLDVGCGRKVPARLDRLFRTRLSVPGWPRRVGGPGRGRGCHRPRSSEGTPRSELRPLGAGTEGKSGFPRREWGPRALPAVAGPSQALRAAVGHLSSPGAPRHSRES